MISVTVETERKKNTQKVFLLLYECKINIFDKVTGDTKNSSNFNPLKTRDNEV